MALNALQRFDYEDELMTLVARCLILEHPLSDRLAKVTLAYARTLPDERLVALSERMTLWLAEAEPAALAAPVEVD